jgi:hypothetical protein
VFAFVVVTGALVGAAVVEQASPSVASEEHRDVGDDAPQVT